MKLKKTIIILENEIDLKTWLSLNKSYNSYNGVKFHLEKDKENPKIKHVIYTFNEDDKITKENRGKSMKQSEFQETVLTAISKINIELNDFKTFIIEQGKFNEEQRKFNREQKNFNESFSKRLDSIEYRLTRLESFHEKDIKNYESFHEHEKDIKKNK